jgi:hypothetical protein
MWNKLVHMSLLWAFMYLPMVLVTCFSWLLLLFSENAKAFKAAIGAAQILGI